MAAGAWITPSGTVTHFNQVDLVIGTKRFVVRYSEAADPQEVATTIQYLKDWLEKNPLKAEQIANGVAEGI